MRSNPGSNRRLRWCVSNAVHAHDIKLPVHVPHACILLMLLVSLFSVHKAFAQDVSVRAELSAPVITRDESVTLTITATGLDAELDASSLERDFDVVGTSSSRQTSLTINSSNKAVNTSVVTWALELMPKGEGVFTVPAVKVGGYSTQLLSLTVNAMPSGALRDVYIETSVDTTEPWVQSQVVMSVRVYEGVSILDGSLNNPEASDLQVERLGDDSVSQQTIDGREYRVTERRFALFPQRSGDMTIDPVTLSVTVPVQSNQSRGFFAPSRRLTRRSDPITLNVQARPSGGAGWWLPARDLKLTDEWQGNPDAAEVGQPLTRTLVIRAEGVLNSQLPEISIPAVDGMSVYAEEPRLAMAPTADGLIVEQRINWALIPQRSGTLTMPAVSVDWFNTAAGQTQTSTLPDQSITVLAAGTGSGNGGLTADSNQALAPSLSQGAGNSTALTPSDDVVVSLGDTDVQSLSPDDLENLSGQAVPAPSLQQISTLQDTVNSWRQLTYIALALWLTTMLAGWMLYRRAIKTGEALPVPDKASSGISRSGQLLDNVLEQFAPMSPLGKACKQGNLPAIKSALLTWAARHWSQDSPNTLDELQMRLPDGTARNKIRRLQAALYGKTSDTESEVVLATDLEDLPVDLKTMLGQGSVVKNGHAGKSGNSRLPDL